MNLSKFTIKSQEALADMQSIASDYGNKEISPEHLPYALIQQDEGAVKAIIKKSAMSGQEDLVLANIMKDLLSEIEKKAKVSGG